MKKMRQTVFYGGALALLVLASYIIASRGFDAVVEQTLEQARFQPSHRPWFPAIGIGF